MFYLKISLNWDYFRIYAAVMVWSSRVDGRRWLPDSIVESLNVQKILSRNLWSFDFYQTPLDINGLIRVRSGCRI